MLLFSLLSLFIFAKAEAGFFSFISNIFEEGQVKNKTDQTVTPENSQLMPILQASLNPNEKASKGGAEILVVDDSALVSEIGPNGSSADFSISDIPKSDQISVYVVQEADTLSQIAKMFNVTIHTIMWANDIENQIITPGTRLVILPVSGVRHAVKSGDTLQSIAKKYGADLDEISQYNGIKEGASLAVGSVIIVPDGEVSAPVSTSSSVAKTNSAGSKSSVSSGYFGHPAPGTIRTQGLHGYNAIDFGAPSGTPILASASGEVLISRSGGWNGGYGNYIVIKHPNGTQTLYAHNSRNIVYVGQRVNKGQVIGYVGSTGRSTGPHLHFEVRGATNPFAR